MAVSTAEALDVFFRRTLSELSASELAMASSDADNSDLRGRWEELYTAQVTSRHLDFEARRLQAAGRGFYTIGSAGHEGNALVALALRPDDPALLHYRSGGFYCARSGQVAGTDPARDVLQGLMGLADEPIAGGRHKVFGRRELDVIPQTSTIASHLPRAVGLALALHRAARLGAQPSWPDDAVVVCSFGDASANHSTAAGSINTAISAAYRGLPVPLLLVCEDNGWGVSVPTPPGWIEHAYGTRPGLAYVDVDGSAPEAAWPLIDTAVARVRRERRPLFLRLRTVRYLGHAGSDAEISYRKPSEIDADYRRDPLLGTARALVRRGSTPGALLATYDRIGERVAQIARELTGAPQLASAEQVTAPLAPRSATRVRDAASALRTLAPPKPRTLAEAINATLAELLAADPRVLVFGEDVGVKGGVYGVTRGLARRFGAARVFDTVLDEQSILGLALGAGLAGLIPIPEIQYLAYLHNAEDQLRGEAATLSFFSSGQYRNPMVLRLPGLAYQRGFGGHFHNDHSVAVLRDIPGLVVACPARADDAAALLRTCVAAASIDGSVSVFLEPIALYHTRDLYAPGDAAWLAGDHVEAVPIGRTRHYGEDVADLVLITFGNGVPMSLRVAERLAGNGIRARVQDLRWLAPLPVAEIVAEARAVGRVLVVDETRHTGGVGEGVITALVESGFDGLLARVSSADSFVPLGPAAAHVLLSEDEIEKAAMILVGKDR
jgi:2-oxoisovalerate dehydrogenase E1 component